MYTRSTTKYLTYCLIFLAIHCYTTKLWKRKTYGYSNCYFYFMPQNKNRENLCKERTTGMLKYKNDCAVVDKTFKKIVDLIPIMSMSFLIQIFDKKNKISIFNVFKAHGPMNIHTPAQRTQALHLSKVSILQTVWDKVPIYNWGNFVSWKQTSVKSHLILFKLCIYF